MEKKNFRALTDEELKTVYGGGSSDGKGGKDNPCQMIWNLCEANGGEFDLNCADCDYSRCCIF